MIDSLDIIVILYKDLVLKNKLYNFKEFNEIKFY